MKLTVKVASLMHFLLNYETLFDNKAIGPFDIKLVPSPLLNTLAVKEIAFSKMPQVTWRAVVLYPEDLIAF